MAKNDYYAIAYRLLKYLYDCLKRSEKPAVSKLVAENFGIKQDYWEYVLRTLTERGYIEGVTLIDVCGRDDALPEIERNIQITPEGIQFLKENSMMAKAKAAAKEARDLIDIFV